MKIMFIGYLHGFGGAEKQLIMLANEMSKRGHDVELVSICQDNECYEIRKSIKRKFIKDNHKSLLRVLDRFFNLKKVIKEYNPDIIINFWFQSVYLTALMPKKMTKRIIYSERGDPGDTEYNGILGIIRKIVFKRVDGFVFQTRVAMQYFNKDVIERSVIIHNPIFLKTSNFYDYEKSVNKIVTIGRLHNQKNQRFLIETFNEFLKQHSDYILEIYGDGELKNELVELVSKLHLTKKVFFMGTKKNVHECILNAKMFILTSDYEGMPNALIEAMSLGIPCISSNYSPNNSVYEFITSGKNGFVYDKNDKNQLIKYMNIISNNQTDVSKISNEARKIYEGNSSEKIYNKWEDFINRIKR